MRSVLYVHLPDPDKWKGLAVSMVAASAHGQRGLTFSATVKIKCVSVPLLREDVKDCWPIAAAADMSYLLLTTFFGPQDHHHCDKSLELLNTSYTKQYFLLNNLVSHSENDICIS